MPFLGKASGKHLGHMRLTNEWVGQRVVKARQRKGWSRARLAREVGWSERMILRVERLQRPLRVGELLVIADVLGTSPAMLLRGYPKVDAGARNGARAGAEKSSAPAV